MTTIGLLTKLREAGLQVAADGESLVIRPRELLTDELRAAVRSQRLELLAALPRYRWRVVDATGRAREICVCRRDGGRCELATRTLG